jgi:Tfp pilus assembly protein PilF
MSLLLQALEKASKDRDNATDTLAADSRSYYGHLALEPMPEPRLIQRGKSTDDSPPEPRSTPDDAADVMRASKVRGYTVLDWARDHYMLTFLAGAALFAVVYGLYVYVQVSNPAWLRSTPAPLSAPVQAVMTPPLPPTEETPRISGLPAASGTPQPSDETPADLTAASDATVEPVAALVNNASNTEPPDTPPRTAATAAITQPSPKVSRQSTPVSQPATKTTRTKSAGDMTAQLDSEGIEVIEIPVGPKVAVLADSAATSNQTDIAVQSQDGAFTRIEPNLIMAYEALQLGQYEEAGRRYSQVLSSDPKNIDAMLGLATIAWKQGRTAAASQHYGRVLEMEPRNTHAQAALIAILGNADPIAAETRLKQLIDREPTGFLYFTLGNLYAERSLWSQAQRAYFQAHQLQPENCDYAFNLAVGLEHLGQARPALEYYRRALDLSFKNGRANFDQQLAIERVGQLSARVD